MKRKKERKEKVTKVIKKNIGTKLITNTKKLKLKIQRLEFQKYNVKENKKKKNQVTKIMKNIYMKFAF